MDDITTAKESCEVAEREASKVEDAITDVQGELRRLDVLPELSTKDLLATENARRRLRALEVMREEAGQAVEKARRVLERAESAHYLAVAQSEQARVKELDAAVGAAVKAADVQIRAALDALREAHSKMNAARLNAREPHLPPEGWGTLTPDLKPGSVFAAVTKRMEQMTPTAEDERAYAVSLARMRSDEARMRLGLLKREAAEKAAADSARALASGNFPPYRSDDRDESMPVLNHA